MTIILLVIDKMTFGLDILGIISFIKKVINHFTPSTARRNNNMNLPSLPQVLHYEDVERVFLTGTMIYSPIQAEYYTMGTHYTFEQAELYRVFLKCIKIGYVIEVKLKYSHTYRGRLGNIGYDYIILEYIYDKHDTIYYLEIKDIECFKFIKDTDNKTKIDRPSFNTPMSRYGY